MNEAVGRIMYIIKSFCYKCEGPLKVAVVVAENGKNIYGPEQFSAEEKKIAENHGVIVRQHHSHTLRHTYDANTCIHCNTFIGQHFLLTEYLVPAQCGDYEFEIVKL